MNFLNAALLAGMLATSIPLLLHLLNRMKPVPIEWGAMQFLKLSESTSKPKIRWTALLLLLLRCAIPIALAICLARPVLTGFRIPGANDRPAIAFIIDTSASMNARTSTDDQSFLDAAKEQVAAIADRFPQAEFSLWSSAVKPVNLLSGSTRDPEVFLSALNKLDGGEGPSDASQAIAVASEFLQQSEPLVKHLIFASDFCSADWESTLAAQKKTTTLDLAQDNSVHLSFMQPKARGPETNLSVSPSTNNRYEIVTGHASQVSFDVRNCSQTETTGTVTLSIDDTEMEQRQFTLAPKAAKTFDFTFQCERDGWYALSAQVAHATSTADALVLDDYAHQIISANAPRRVLIVYSTPGRQLDYLQLALAPFPDAISNRNRFQVDQLAESELSNLLDSSKLDDRLSEYAAVILLQPYSKVKDYDESTISEVVAEYVREGGGLVVIPGPSSDLAVLNQQLHESLRLLPAEFESTIDVPPEARIASGTRRSASLEDFNVGRLGKLDEITFNQIWPLKIPDPAESDTTSRSIASLLLTTGSPLLLSQRFGSGRLVQCGFSCDDATSNLPLRSPFVALMHKITQSVIKRSGNPNVQCAEPLTLPLFRNPSENVDLATPQLAKLEANRIIPDRPELTIPIQRNNTKAYLASTSSPGLYEITPTQEAPFLPEYVAVRLPRSESELEQLSSSDLRTVASKLGAEVLSSPEDFVRLTNEQRDGREIWQWFLFATLALLVAETYVASRISRGL